MKNIYVLRNRKGSFYLDPFFKVEESDAMKVQLERFCIVSQDEAIKSHFDEAELYKLGMFNDETAEIALLEKPEFIVDLSQYFFKDQKGN